SFLVERAGEEVVITYLQRLLGRDIKYLEVLFPTVINSYGNYNFAYSTSFLASLREAFYVDLQLLDLRLAELLSDPDFFGELQADPVFYNIMAVYVLSSLVQQEVPVVEAIPVVHNFLYQRYADDDKARNLQIVNTAADKPAYAEVVAASEAVLKELTAAYLSLYRAEEALLPRYQLVTATAFMRNEKLDLPPFDQFFDQEKYSLAALLGVAEDPQPYDLTYLPSLLKGRLDTTIAAGLTTVADYDQFYGSQIVPTEWRAAGLAMARRLTGEWYNHTSLGQLLRQQREALIQYDALLLKAEERVGITDPMQAQTERVEQGLQQLSASLQATADYWSEVLTADDEQAFQLLQKLATDFRLIEDDPFANPSDVLSQKTQRLAAVEERFFALNGRIAARGDSVAGINPIRLYRERPATPLPGQLVRIEVLETRLQELSESLENLDAAYAPNLSAGRRNAEPILKVTELLSLAFYGLQDQSADQSLITIGRFDTLLRDPLQRTAILGLLEQQLSFSRIGGGISSEGLGLFARTTLEELAAIPPKGTPARDSLGGYYLAAFATHTLNRTLQMPLFANPLNPGRTQSLVNIYPDLADVPSATENTLDVIYNLKTKNHRRALSSFLLLMQDLTAMLDDPDGSPQREKVIDFIRQYGMFIGGLVDADRPEEVQYLLQTMADPPGSSQVKRREPFTANINGYVGISLGQERLRGSALATDPAFATLAPAMPVGVSFSRLIGYDRWKYPQSFSLFFSVLDLGALATFNLDQELPGENELRFQNVLKPGV
ncbi:MAG: hypothetical protein KDC54_13430, partial [Lewinella sp.]|nr:hypothetical protein [Lewinella sp.]